MGFFRKPPTGRNLSRAKISRASISVARPIVARRSFGGGLVWVNRSRKSSKKIVRV